jgi:hypothetical protein
MHVSFPPLVSLFGSSLAYWSTGLITQFLDLSQAVGLLGRVISSSQGLYLNTGQHNPEKRGHTLNIHAQGEIRTRNHGLRAIEDCSCLRPLCYRDRPNARYIDLKSSTKFLWIVIVCSLHKENVNKTSFIRRPFISLKTAKMISMKCDTVESTEEEEEELSCLCIYN